MLKEISDDIRSAFQSNRNGLVQLLVVNIALFVLSGSAKVVAWASGASFGVDAFVLDYFGLSSNLLQFLLHPWTLLTYAIVHLDIYHFIFNMLGLYFFGLILQDFLGPKRILYFYLFGALAGGLLYLLIFNLIGAQSMHPPAGRALVGASGAVYGIICGAAFLVPNYSMNLLFFGPVRLKYIALATVFISFLQIPNGNPGGNIAHLGGALGGILYLKYLQGTFRFTRSSRLASTPASAPKGKVVSMSRSSSKISAQEELDLLLDKISEKGIQSLTKEERTRLEELSKPGN